MGGEFAQWREWNHDRSLDWHLLADPAHAAIRQYVQALNTLYQAEPALHQADFDPAGFRWIRLQRHREQRRVARALRERSPRIQWLMVCNFTPVPRLGYRIGVPDSGFYAELPEQRRGRHSAASNVGNEGGVASAADSRRTDSISRSTSPSHQLGCLLLKNRL